MIEIKKKELTEMVNNGAKKDEIAAKYNLTSAATARLLKEAGLKIKKTHKPTFKLIEEDSQVAVVTAPVSPVEAVNI